MMDLFPVRELLRSRMSPGGTHWGECWRTHVDCAAWRLLEVVDRLELEHDELLADNEQLLAEVEQLRRERAEWRKKAEGFRQSWDSLADEMTEVEDDNEQLMGRIVELEDGIGRHRAEHGQLLVLDASRGRGLRPALPDGCDERLWSLLDVAGGQP